jgi:hypothetical protein
MISPLAYLRPPHCGGLISSGEDLELNGSFLIANLEGRINRLKGN